MSESAGSHTRQSRRGCLRALQHVSKTLVDLDEWWCCLGRRLQTHPCSVSSWCMDMDTGQHQENWEMVKQRTLYEAATLLGWMIQRWRLFLTYYFAKLIVCFSKDLTQLLLYLVNFFLNLFSYFEKTRLGVTLHIPL